MLRRILGEDVILNHKLEEELWGVEADRGQLEQVIMSLCFNVVTPCLRVVRST